MSTLNLDTLHLESGSHATRADGVCALEAVAWLAGEPHSDHPVCVSPVLGAFLRQWNDDLDDAGRQRLKPYLPRVIGTAGNAEADERRAWMATDWLVRVHTPAWMDLAGCAEHATALRALPRLDSPATASAEQPTINAARDAASAARAAARAAAGAAAGAAAWDAARAAAGAAAGAAARDAAGDAARAAAGDAAGDAAGAAAWAAAGDAAGAAAGAAAWDAATKKLESTTKSLQESAFDLLDRMIAA